MVGEEALAPGTELPCCVLEFVIEDMHRLSVRGRLAPCRKDHLLKARHLGPEILEPEGGRASGAILT